MSKTLDELIDKIIDRRIEEMVAARLKQRLEADTQSAPPAAPATPPSLGQPSTLVAPTVVPRQRHQKWPVGTVVRINQTFLGNPAAPGTQVYEAFKTARELLGYNEVNRLELARNLETLLGWPKNFGSAIVSRMLEAGALTPVHREKKRL